MKKWPKVILLLCLLFLVLGGVLFIKKIQVRTTFSEATGNQTIPKGEEVMTQHPYIDPKIDLTSRDEITIIINFKTKPAKTAVALAEAAGIPLTLEKAEQDVEESHARFRADVEKYLGHNQVPYTIVHTYKAALNGVAMKLPANEIKTLIQSAEIESIYANREVQIQPPIRQPS